MRAVIIDPKAKTIEEISMATGHKALKDIIGDYPERAAILADGDQMFVDCNGFIKEDQAFFDIGAHQHYAGKGVIIGSKDSADATITIQAAEALVNFVRDRPLPPMRSIECKDAGEAFAFLIDRRQSANFRAETKENERGAVLHYSLIDVTDEDLEPVDDDGDEDGGLYPHMEMFAETGTTELVSVAVKYGYRITDMGGVRWHLPSGLKAQALRAALEPGQPLVVKLSDARRAMLEDAGILAACASVLAELQRLGGE